MSIQMDPKFNFYKIHAAVATLKTSDEAILGRPLTSKEYRWLWRYVSKKEVE